jgi:hypothetical protein
MLLYKLYFSLIALLVAKTITPRTINNTPNALFELTSSLSRKYARTKVNIGELKIRAETI